VPKNNLLDASTRFGFPVEGELAEAHDVLVAVIPVGSPLAFRSAWEGYRLQADKRADEDSNPRLRVGRHLAMAAVWRAAHERVRYWRSLYEALELASEHHFETELLEVVSRQLQQAQGGPYRAEYLQAIGHWEEALIAYEQLDADECLTDHKRGLLQLRMAECYQGQLEDGMDAEDADPADQQLLHELLEHSIRSALAYLTGLPEKALAERLRAEVGLEE
jgi:hypothetical protein